MSKKRTILGFWGTTTPSQTVTDAPDAVSPSKKQRQLDTESARTQTRIILRGDSDGPRVDPEGPSTNTTLIFPTLRSSQLSCRVRGCRWTW